MSMNRFDAAGILTGQTGDVAAVLDAANHAFEELLAAAGAPATTAMA
jgi:hypothetical protein